MKDTPIAGRAEFESLSSGNQPTSAPPDYSVVIAVFNSAEIVGDTIDACCEYFENRGISFELVLVNDGSRDLSWSVVLDRARDRPEVTAVNLLRNYGQHTATLCGLRYCHGTRVVTLDDDLQNPPEEIEHLISTAEKGHDLVFGVPRQKQHSAVRRWGSTLVNALNRRIFGKPPELVLTNFRLIDRQVVGRILANRTHYPYINGLALLYSHNPANVEVEHRRREEGQSNYGLRKIAEVICRILFNYSSYPLRVVSFLGLAVSLLSFVLAGYFFLRGVLREPVVPGWASVAVMLSFFNGISLLLLGMLGEYMLRILRQVSQDDPYHVIQVYHGGT